MINLSFLHTHYIPNSLEKADANIKAIVALEFYPDIIYSYYNEVKYFTDIIECLQWYKKIYANEQIRFTIENISILNNMSLLEEAKKMGLIVYQIFHNNSNSFFDVNCGLTPKGLHLLEHLATNDLYLDLSHLNDIQINQILEVYSGKILVSHCACKDIIETKHHRTNAISTNTIIELAKRNCVFGIPFVNDIICNISHDTYENDDVILNDIVSQILYFCKAIGADKVSLSPDFMDLRYFSRVFGQSLKIPDDLYYCVGYGILRNKLSAAGLSQNDIDNVFFRNVDKLFFDNEPMNMSCRIF